MLGQYLHYLVAERSGRSALIEFSDGELVVIPNSGDWQQATNFLLSESSVIPEDMCWRYGLISGELSKNEGLMSPQDAIGLLKDVAQESTQWSVVYSVDKGEIRIAMGGNFNKVYKLNFEKLISQ